MGAQRREPPTGPEGNSDSLTPSEAAAAGIARSEDEAAKLAAERHARVGQYPVPSAGDARKFLTPAERMAHQRATGGKSARRVKLVQPDPGSDE